MRGSAHTSRAVLAGLVAVLLALGTSAAISWPDPTSSSE
jgi:hypothetical protein